MNLVDELHAVVAALRRHGIVHAVCGGVAVTIHGATRSTKDIDFLVRRADADRILEVLRPLGYVYAALPMVFDQGTARERHVQRVSKVEAGEHLVVDLLFEEAAFAGLLAGSIEVELPEGPLTVVSLETLKRMKRLASRALDLADLEKLEEEGG